jgi:shikimate dehydrogenase
MPHKEAMARLVDRRTPLADRLEAVNCVTLGGDDTTGDNTDGPGLVAALRRGEDFDPQDQRCLVVGGGGAARAVVAALSDAGAAEVVVVNRSVDRARTTAALAGPVGRVGAASDAGSCRLVVNATPLGMGAGGGGTPAWPVDPALLGPHHLVVDLVYHPAVTPWLQAARSRGARTANGLGMLVHQAALQLEAWTDREAPVEAMWRAVQPVQPGQ